MIILMSLLMFYLDVIILCCIFVFMLRMLLFNFWDVYLFGFPAKYPENQVKQNVKI
jgi:hypothetical protein